jgi:hypothetical protein
MRFSTTEEAQLGDNSNSPLRESLRAAWLMHYSFTTYLKPGYSSSEDDANHTLLRWT